jgi:hypothetical protein
MSGIRGSDLRWLIELLFSDGDRRVGSLVSILSEARLLCDQAKSDLSLAHAEICKLQGLDPAAHSWPEWSPQANTLRWIDEKLIPQIDEALGGKSA